jgi:DNA repair protein RadD
VQQLGRVMRIHEGKDQAIWLCHSGNYLRFRDQWDDLYSNGVLELDDGAEKTKPEPTDKEKEAAKCPKCSALWTALADICSNCGHVRERKNDVVALAGEMSELGKATEKYSSETKERWYQELLGYARGKGYADGWAWHKYQEKFHSKPPWKKVAAQVSQEVQGWITHLNIKQRYRK